MYYIYIMASYSGTLYIGMTNNLERRVQEHKLGIGSYFTRKYTCKKLVYFEEYQTPREAIAREKVLKGWKRIKKQNLISSMNPHWKDLAQT